MWCIKGKRILVTGEPDGNLCEALVDAISEKEGIPYPLYPMVVESSADAITQMVDRLPAMDAVINCHGRNFLRPLGMCMHPSDTEALEKVLWTNVFAPYAVMNAVVGKCRAQGLGSPEEPVRILNVASQTYRVPQRMTSMYCASKAALVQLTKVAARELAPDFIVNAIAPGKILGTNMTRLTDAQVLELRGWAEEDADAYAKKMIPMGRFTTREEVAEAALLLLQMPPYVTGTVLEIMGGV